MGGLGRWRLSEDEGGRKEGRKDGRKKRKWTRDGVRKVKGMMGGGRCEHCGNSTG